MNTVLNADMATLRAWLVAGLRWWQGELAGIVPRRWREARTRRLAFYAYHPERGDLEPLPGADGAGPAPDLPAAVVLPAHLTLIRTIDYPAVRAGDLASLIELDRDRIMPQGRDAVLAARVVAHDPASGRMQVAVAGLPLARAEALAQALALALARGSREPACILTGMPEPAAPAPIDLLPALRRAGLIGGTLRSPAPLWLTVAFLFLLNIGLLVWRDSAALGNLADAVDQQQPAVNVAHRIIARMHDDDRIAQQAIAARRTAEPLALMARIDRALPPGSWVRRFSWQGGTLQLAGYHPPRADVSGALRRAGLAVAHYGDTAEDAPTPLGEPFEVTLKPGPH